MLAKLRPAIGAKGRVAPFALQIVEVERLAFVRARGDVDDTGRFGGLQQSQQAQGQRMVSEMVEREGHLEPVGGERTLLEERAGIVDQHVDAAETCAQRISEPRDFH